MYLGKILSLAQVTVFLVPKPEQFLLAQIILGNINGTKEQNQDFSFKVRPRILYIHMKLFVKHLLMF